MELYVMMTKMVQRYRMEYTGEQVGALTRMVSIPDRPITITFNQRCF